MRRILEKGSTDLYWTYRTTAADLPGNVTFDWLFLEGFPKVTLTLEGDHGKRFLKRQKLPEGQRLDLP